MRRYLFIALLGLLVSTPALGQKKGGLQQFSGQVKQEQSAEELKEARRKAAGITDIKGFGVSREPPPKPFPWLAIGLVLIFMAAAAPFGWKMYKSTRGDLEDLSTFGMGKGRRAVKEAAESAGALPISRRPPARAAKKEAAVSTDTRIVETGEGQVTPRHAVGDAITNSGGNWVTADWVATKASLPGNSVSEEIAALVEDGYLQEARDSRGKPVFRANPEAKA
jgi:hypothetical protein